VPVGDLVFRDIHLCSRCGVVTFREKQRPLLEDPPRPHLSAAALNVCDRNHCGSLAL
jgi:hypothetical protein